MTKLEELKKMKADYTAALKEHSKGVIAEHYGAVFAAHPDVIGIRWTQYTPHFNDGEACVFGVNELEFLFSPDSGIAKKAKAKSSVFDLGDGWLSGYGSAAAKFHPVFGTERLDEDILEGLGDGVRITIHRDMKMEIDEYDHD